MEKKLIKPVVHDNWVTPIVVVKKANASARICANFSTGLNNALLLHQHPLPLRWKSLLRAIRFLTGQVSGGAKIDIENVPWTMQFRAFLRKDEKHSYYISCACSLISPEFVLLAAHCFDGVKNGAVLSITYNTSKKEWHLNATDVKQRVTEHRHDRTNVFIHPNYNSETVVFDLALIKLSHPLKTPPFQPICINCGAANKFQNGTAFVSGWGQLEDTCKRSSTSSKVLMGRYAKLINCQKESEAEGQICVEPNILQHGDSGSALLASNGTAFVLIGVHSSGICNTKSNESVEALYTPLDKEWIDDITGFNCPV
ncbi:hypothetical protein niasHT_004468 [Heterodera trifolii]|uniref:Peptidase S1 domain-containing protein n=1 Tax=Heterodera trifolii TaxID=157864 RepID=A0ABD2MDB3_9BILA